MKHTASPFSSAFREPFSPELARAIRPSELIEEHRNTFGDSQMATIANAPLVITDAIVTVGADDYQAAINVVQFIPTSQQVTFQGMTPSAAFVGQTIPTWVCKIGYAQDWKTANSFAQYLLANSLTQKVCVFKPQGSTTGNPIITATLLIVPGPIGGPVNAVTTAEVSLGVVGAPVRTVAP